MKLNHRSVNTSCSKVTNSDDGTIDFGFYTSTIRIVSVDIPGYDQAIRIFRQYGLQYETTRKYLDIWSFCLKFRTVRFNSLSAAESQRQRTPEDIANSREYICPVEALPEGSMYWLALKQRPEFVEHQFNNDIQSMKHTPVSPKRSTLLGTVEFSHDVQIHLSYGALTAINTYHFHPQYSFQRQKDWTVIA